MPKVSKKVTVDKASLKDWMKAKNIDYKGLAELTGMSTTQAYNLVRYGSGGPVTLGYLVGTGVPLFLVTYEHIGQKKRISDVQQLVVRAV